MPVLVCNSMPSGGCSLLKIFRSRLFTAVILLLVASFCLCPAPACAAGKLGHVHLMVAGKELVSSVPAIADDTEVYAPLEVLKVVDAKGQLSPHGDTVIVTEQSTGRTLELALARVNGSSMIALSDLGHVVDGIVVRTPARKGERSGTVCFAARIFNVRMDGNRVQVETSFPVQYRVEAEPAGSTSNVDCEGAVLDGYYLPQQIVGVKALQLSSSTVRLEVTLPKDVIVQPTDGRYTPTRAFTGNFITRPKLPTPLTPLPAASGPVAGDFALHQVRDAPDDVASHRAAPEPPPTRLQSPVGTTIVEEGPVQGPKIAAHDGAPAVQSGARIQPSQIGPVASRNVPAEIGVVGSGGANAISGQKAASVLADPVKVAGQSSHSAVPAPMPIEIRSLSFLTDNTSRARIELLVSGKASAIVRYVPGTTQMVIDIANAVISLPDQDTGDRTMQHPLVNHLSIAAAPGQPNTARVEIETSRIVGYTLNTLPDRVTLDLRVPRNATGALSDKLVVVDAGHGGSATGAAGRGAEGTVYEKTITLAIAMKLRALLEQCGARVVVTRDADVDVPLYDRPKLANTIGADLFISIHNDSTLHLNSATGTTTYYHSTDSSSRALAVCVQDAVRAVTGLPSKGALSDSVLYASGLAVLRNSTMPAVLCEVAYINNSGDRSKLVDHAFQERVAQAMCDGLRNYVEGRPRPASRQIDPEVSSPDSVTIHSDDPTH